MSVGKFQCPQRRYFVLYAESGICRHNMSNHFPTHRLLSYIICFPWSLAAKFISKPLGFIAICNGKTGRERENGRDLGLPVQVIDMISDNLELPKVSCQVVWWVHSTLQNYQHTCQVFQPTPSKFTRLESQIWQHSRTG